MNTSANIKTRINHDSMWIYCMFPSGGHFKYTVLRYGAKFELAFSNDEDESKEQMKIFQSWIKKQNLSYGDLFKKLEELCLTCKSGKQLINKMS